MSDPRRPVRTPATGERVRLDRLLDESDRRTTLHDATLSGLRSTPKQLHPVWLYDEHGALLFEEITELQEYYLPRAEREILHEQAVELAELTRAATLVELGSGASEKTRIILDALVATGSLRTFAPLDVSEEQLVQVANQIAADYPTLEVHAVLGDFERHLTQLPREERRLIAFLGSTIGNLEPERRARFLTTCADVLADGEFLLVGLDLVKDPIRLTAAYNDGQGLTERFIRNGLEAVNRELGATFRQKNFTFESRWAPEHEWVDLGFRARVAHTVVVSALDLTLEFAEGEQLRLEISSKFRKERFVDELRVAGLELEHWWTDANADFAVALARHVVASTPA